MVLSRHFPLGKSLAHIDFWNWGVVDQVEPFSAHGGMGDNPTPHFMAAIAGFAAYALPEFLKFRLLRPV